MRSYRNFLVVVSLAFVVFSAVFGARYTKLREDRRSIGRYSYGNPTREQSAREEAEQNRIDAAQDGIHSLVKPVSIAYYLLCLGFFIRVVKASPWRKLAIFGAVACVFMTLWSLVVGPGASFDEVYPAWIVAGIVLPLLQLVVLPAPAQDKAA